MLNVGVPWTDYAQVAKQYNISNPDTFIDRLIDIADGSIDPRHSSSPVYTKANWAAFALLAFAGSHTLPAPYDFYSNQTVSRRQLYLAAVNLHARQLAG